MVKEIRIYAEGGGNDAQTKTLLREGFNNFLKGLVAIARAKRIRWHIIACGSRNQAYSDFVTALQTHPDAFNVLLVDSEEPVSKSPWLHLQERDNWNAEQIGHEHCHLMVQTMEAWLIADLSALKRFYGQGFNENPYRRIQMWNRSKRKRCYQHSRMPLAILRRANITKPDMVSEFSNNWKLPKFVLRPPHCDRLFMTLAEKMNS